MKLAVTVWDGGGDGDGGMGVAEIIRKGIPLSVLIDNPLI